MSTVMDSTAVKIRLIKRFEVAHDTMAFRFEKPDGWAFKAGQSVDMTLLEPPETDAEGNTRAFSIASAPHEPTLMVATRIRDTAFKRVLKSMPIGSEVKIDGPFGSFSLHNNAARPAIILAGGIGITPFRSMVLHACKEKLPHRILLFYSNWRPEDAAFLEELESLQTQNPNYKLVATMTEIRNSNRLWKGETGLINQELIDRHFPDRVAPARQTGAAIYYVAGPPAMVNGLRTMLTNAGVDTDDIRSEEFAGY
jgi:ferredoxin-NADP reductase